MTRILKIVIGLALSWMVAGCGMWREYIPMKPEAVESRAHQEELGRLLARFDLFMTLPLEKLSREYDGALLDLAAHPNPANGLEAAFLHALLGCPQKGAKQIKAAMKQFEDRGYANDRNGFRGVAVLVNMALGQLQENERLRIKLNEEKEFSERLAHQLNELKNIEKIIYERENHKLQSK
ncbi:MAG: hypothetical protein JXB25_03210 [Deltaproteobacteria bacterium]|nr:hypothetical protein [Deltaproteobacteria bacterium]